MHPLLLPPNTPRHVQLKHQSLREFPPALYALTDTLEVLDLSNNQLTGLPDDLHRFTRLRILFASNNPFTELPPVLGRCPQLEMVGFKACAIVHVPEDSLPPALRWLILTDNCIATLPDTLGQRPHLQKLMLSCNALDRLPDLSACHRLELLRLADNHFHAIPPTVFTLPALAWLAVAGNPLSACSEATMLTHARDKAWPIRDLSTGEPLGEGTSGVVHRAHHHRTRIEVALKQFKAARTSDGRPHSEMAAGLRAQGHPNVLAPLAYVDGMPENRPATVLPLLGPQYVPLAGPPDLVSCTRDVYAADTRFSAVSGQRLLADTRRAVQHLHARGVIHGDVYAHNILWDPGTGHAMLSDFGAAVITEGLPDAQVAALQAIEWRAFSHLEREVIARCQ